MKFSDLEKEAAKYGIRITDGDGVTQPIRFKVEEITMSWMYRNKDVWSGYTRCPEISDVTIGTKIQVGNWCLDWAVNGF